MGLFDFFRSKKEPKAESQLRPIDVEAGARVLALWPGEVFYYPATVKEVSGDKVKVAYDDGDTSVIQANQVREIDINEGSKVFARWQGGKSYLPATVKRQAGEKIAIQYDDGRTEQTTISMVRVFRGNPWKKGDRVLANWGPEPFFYPGHIQGVTQQTAQVRFDDGDQAEVPAEVILPCQMKEGDLVFARWQRGPEYRPATITSITEENIYVEYDDGRSEDTIVSMVRVLPGMTMQEWKQISQQL